ncbi:hypothetical protein OAC03_05820 [Amylibacter sp.]|nr:hypothetical protein [Amylibacter sp.]
MIGKIPNDFLYQSASDLVRIGRDNDGGYLVSQSDIEKSELLIGLGICDDWSFEEGFVQLNDINVVAFDASLGFRFWVKKAIFQTIKNPFSLYPLRKFISYRKFFKGKHKHVKKFVGLNSLSETHCTFVDVLNETDSQNIFLKIDIEGSEYRFLDDIIANEKRISGMVLELHDCDIHLERIQNFIKKLSLKLVHVHANNYAPIRASDGLPLVLELSFSKNCEKFCMPSLPHKLDMPNSKKSAEIQLIIDG